MRLQSKTSLLQEMQCHDSLVQPCVNVVDCANLDSEFPIFLFLFSRIPAKLNMFAHVAKKLHNNVGFLTEL